MLRFGETVFIYIYNITFVFYFYNFVKRTELNMIFEVFTVNIIIIFSFQIGIA